MCADKVGIFDEIIESFWTSIKFLQKAENISFTFPKIYQPTVFFRVSTCTRLMRPVGWKLLIAELAKWAEPCWSEISCSCYRRQYTSLPPPVPNHVFECILKLMCGRCRPIGAPGSLPHRLPGMWQSCAVWLELADDSPCSHVVQVQVTLFIPVGKRGLRLCSDLIYKILLFETEALTNWFVHGLGQADTAHMSWVRH